MKNLVLALIFACVVVPASTHAQNAYITNLDSNSLAVIAHATNPVIGLAIPVGLSPLGAVVTPDRSKVYVANHASNTVSVIDTATNSVSATIPVGASPFGVAATPDGNKVYVAHDSAPGAVSVIDIATNTVVGSPIPLSTAAVGVAAAPDSSKVYVATAIRVGRGTGGVSVIDTATNTVIATILIDRVHNGVAVTADGRKLYVAGSRGRCGGGRPDSVSVIDPDQRGDRHSPRRLLPLWRGGGPRRQQGLCREQQQQHRIGDRRGDQRGDCHGPRRPRRRRRSPDPRWQQGLRPQRGEQHRISHRHADEHHQR